MLGKNQYFLKILSGFSYFTIQILDNATVTKTDNLKNSEYKNTKNAWKFRKFDESVLNYKKHSHQLAKNSR